MVRLYLYFSSGSSHVCTFFPTSTFFLPHQHLKYYNEKYFLRKTNLRMLREGALMSTKAYGHGRTYQINHVQERRSLPIPQVPDHQVNHVVYEKRNQQHRPNQDKYLLYQWCSFPVGLDMIVVILKFQSLLQR